MKPLIENELTYSRPVYYYCPDAMPHLDDGESWPDAIYWQSTEGR